MYCDQYGIIHSMLYYMNINCRTVEGRYRQVCSRPFVCQICVKMTKQIEPILLVNEAILGTRHAYTSFYNGFLAPGIFI